ncbi:Uncharacterised protein [Mycobacteroides abscessus subsp. abscessus]|nr:Uncharacterised protein [Mycobacteroides abscessus subsp. abscessus]
MPATNRRSSSLAARLARGVRSSDTMSSRTSRGIRGIMRRTT